MMMSRRALTSNRRQLSAVVVALALLLAACGGSSGQDNAASPSSQPTTSQVLSPEDFSAYITQNPDVPLINVHIPYEGHIEGTDDFVAFDAIADWEGLPDDKDAPLAIYCRSGNMSATAAETLASMGYRNVVDLEGGMKAWSSAGYDLLDDEPASN